MISNVAKPTLFADDKSIIITNSGPSDFKKNYQNKQLVQQ